MPVVTRLWLSCLWPASRLALGGSWLPGLPLAWLCVASGCSRLALAYLWPALGCLFAGSGLPLAWLCIGCGCSGLPLGFWSGSVSGRRTPARNAYGFIHSQLGKVFIWSSGCAPEQPTAAPEQRQRNSRAAQSNPGQLQSISRASPEQPRAAQSSPEQPRDRSRPEAA